MSLETILVVDDNVQFAHLLSTGFLKQLGYQTLIAFDGEAAFQKIITEQPDLVIMDIHMPRMSGLDVLVAMQQLDTRPPVILMTVHGSEETAVQAFRLGAKNYINKPFAKDHLQIIIDEALREKRLLQEKTALQNNLIAAKTVRQTIITLSHHLNNHLMSAKGSLELLRETVLAEENLDDRQDMLEMLQNSRQSIDKIEKVLHTLEEINTVEPIAYYNDYHMLDT